MRVVKSFPWVIALRFRLRQAALLWLHTIFKKPIANAYIFTGVFMRVLGIKSAGLKLILKGRRVSNVAWANSIIGNIVYRGTDTNSEMFELLGDAPDDPIEGFADWLLILKLPVLVDSKLVEKGAIIFKFSEMFAPAFLLLNVRLLSRYFRIILEPSSVGYSLPEILIWETLNPEKVIVLSPYQDDFQFLSTITNYLVPMTLGPADWVDTTRFHKVSGKNKIYDAIYVANFNPIKRVERFIQAIVRVSRVRPDYNAAIVFADHGAAKKEVLEILEYAKKYASIEVFNNLEQDSINGLFNESKVNILVSLREGSNKGLAEGLFSGTPALLIKENVGGNHLHINKMTGRVIPDAELEKTLIWFADHHDEFAPQEWAMKHIAPPVSANILSKKIKSIELLEGRQWTKELFAKVNRPELGYLDSESTWLLSKRAELLNRFSRGADEKNVITFLEMLQKTATD